MDSRLGGSELVRLLGNWFDPDSGALYQQLAERMAAEIARGAIPSGMKLPSERALAYALNVSRSTIVAAFDELRAKGLLISRHGAGTFVTSAGRNRLARGDSRLETFGSEPVIDQVDLRSAALPGLSMVTEVASAMDWRQLTPLLHSHGYLPAGLSRLREAVAAYYEAGGLTTSPDQIAVTSGAQQALRLLATALLDRGSPVLLEEPTFRGAIETLRAAGVRLVPVNSGPHGIDISHLDEQAARSRARVLFVQATGHNPTGVVMDRANRSTLMAAAARLRLTVIEDASVADLVLDTIHPHYLGSFGTGAITIGSASKLFWGGLRIGWIRADPEVVAELVTIKSAEDLGTSLPGQFLTAELLNQADSARHLRRVELRQARSHLIDLLAAELPEWTCSVPAGGASAWIRLPSVSATRLSQAASRQGVAVLPGPTFSSVDGLDDWLRIGFALGADDLRVGIRRLAGVWRDLQPSPVH